MTRLEMHKGPVEVVRPAPCAITSCVRQLEVDYTISHTVVKGQHYGLEP